jgi:RND family efflux transporter MFP subunit
LSDTTALKSDEQSIIEKQQSLDQTNAGTDTLDLQSAELTVTKAQNALLDAQNTLADYAIRAPFAGTIAKVDVKRGDQASSGTSAVTIITKDQIAELSLNEVDAAKVKVGQKATLTFDAIEDLSIAGTVASVDTLGTVTQGVVSYAVKIDFNTQDARVKPGMTVNANIIVQTAQDVLSVPSSAIKNQNGQSYVQVFRPPLPESTDNTTGVLTPRVPENVSVVTGISDDTSVQIVTGLQLGEQIVVRSVSGTASAVPSRATAGGNTRNAGFGGPGGGALRGL